MTFKDIRIWSRIKDAHAFNSMLWLNLFVRDRPYNKIRDWMYALQEYKRYKNSNKAPR